MGIRTATLIESKKPYIKVRFPLSLSMTRQFKKVKGSEYKGLGNWAIPLSQDNIELLKGLDFIFNRNLQKWKIDKIRKDNPIRKIKAYKKRKLKPRPYQWDGCNHVEKRKGRALIADEPGLGKTIQALMYLQVHKEIKRTLIIVPSSLKINWQRETEKWVTRNQRIQILDGQTPYKITGKVVIINYDILTHWADAITDHKFQLIIADEIHYCKNPKSLRTKAFVEISKFTPNLIGLTGTPIENDPIEIFHIVNLIDKTIFPNWMKFIQRYCNAKKKVQWVRIKNKRTGKLEAKRKEVWSRNGISNVPELHRILTETVMIRRLKKDVEDQLPPKEYADVAVRIDNRKEYEEAEKNFIEYISNRFEDGLKAEVKAMEHEISSYLKSHNIKTKSKNKTLSKKQIKQLKADKIKRISGAPTLVKIEALKQLAAAGKMAQVISWIENFLETGEKLIVFGVNKKVITALHGYFEDVAVKVDGSVRGKKRQFAVDQFQTNKKVKLFIGNIKAAGVGLTLTAASKVAIVQFPWNPGQVIQAEDRVHRITQTKKVTIYKFIAVDTIEEKIIKLLNDKQHNIDQIIDGKTNKLKPSIMIELVKLYKRRA